MESKRPDTRYLINKSCKEIYEKVYTLRYHAPGTATQWYNNNSKNMQ